jgi:RHS repeat-associated protein
MTKVQKVASGVTKTINYTYNAAGLRVRRVDTSTSVTKLWTYQGNNIASVSTKSGGSFGDTSTQEWAYTVAPGMINNVLERHKANYAATTTTSEFYQYDHRGNVAAVTDASGKILRGYQYDAFGNIPFSFATGQSGAAPTDDILFTGKDLDPDTGLYYFNARWYDAETGRWIAHEPTGKDGPPPYLFARNEPLEHVDPTGLEAVAIGGDAFLGYYVGGHASGYLVFDDCNGCMLCFGMAPGLGIGFGAGVGGMYSPTPVAPGGGAAVGFVGAVPGFIGGGAAGTYGGPSTAGGWNGTGYGSSFSAGVGGGIGGMSYAGVTYCIPLPGCPKSTPLRTNSPKDCIAECERHYGTRLYQTCYRVCRSIK